MSASKTTKSLYRIFSSKPISTPCRTKPSSTPSKPGSTKPTTRKTHDLLAQSFFDERDLTRFVENFKTLSDIPYFRSRQRIYEIAVLRLASAEKFSLIEEIIQHQKKYDNITSEGFAKRLICLYGKAGMFDHAFKLFDELPQLNCQRTLLSFNALLTACVQSKQFNKVEKLFRDMPLKLSIVPNVVTYNIVIQALCGTGSFDSAESMLGEMESNEVTPSLITFNTIMHGFYYNERFSDGERIWARMENSGIAPDIVSYNGKMQGLLNGGKISEAVELFEELQSRKLKPNLITYNFLIKAYCNDGNLEAAIRTYDLLLKKRYVPNRSTLETLIPFIYEKGDIDRALKLCKENVSVNCYIGVGTLQTVVNGLVKASRTEEAEKLLATSKLYAYYSQVKMPSEDSE
ncbi:hypothetical protein AQUCO_00500381v1 [Aquilegia coerulea]|uniref:Pentacotripeptide-repeat region of PRORP domain-containing protein n=1 Tax=Aquilegia coerulea TaxID=218851 RepID=A0A2G5ERP6_AQUCA|nr:hypothetical protein AQUCO_00500381v1 [Aquilegia coerulea]